MADPRILSLCSGIGGLDEGVRLVYPRSRVVGHVERDAYAASVILERMARADMEPAPVWCGDLGAADLSGFRGRADWITAGYPCQPFSVAGRRKGEDDPRHLWPVVRRAVGVVRPRFVFLENVAGHLRLGFDRVLGDLAEDGFDAAWTLVRASDVGAPHRRERLFILARRVSDAKRDAIREGQGRLESRRTGEAELGDMGAPVADASGRLQGLSRRAHITRRDGLDGVGGAKVAHSPICWPPHPEPFPPGPDDASGWKRWLEAGGPPPALPRVRRGADGLPEGLDMGWRTDRLRCLGNAVVPQQAARALRELMEANRR